jgi:DNA-binding Lrp family transcriptional regulator
MLTNTDSKLITALEEDGRLSYAELSRNLGISIPTVIRRVKSLVKNKIFTINAVPNPYKLGYFSQAIIAMNVPYNRVRNVCEDLKRIYNINLIVTTFGRFNLLAIVYYPTWNELHDFISSKLSGRSDISEIDTYFVKDARKRYYGFSIDGDHESGSIKIDETDQKIMDELSKNGRTSNLYLASKLGISVSAVSRRVTNLLNEDIIKIQAIVDPNKTGYHVNSFILIKADHNKMEDICTRLAGYDEVISMMTLLNGYDIFVSVVAQRHESLYELIREMIAPIEGIISMETLIRGDIVKRYYGLFHSNKPELNNQPEQTVSQ